MMNRTCCFVGWVIVASFVTLLLRAQEDFSNRGREFYLTFLPNYHNKLLSGDRDLPGDSVLIFIGGATVATQVQIDAIDIFGGIRRYTFVLNPGQIQRLVFPAALYELRGDNWGEIPYVESMNGRIVKVGFYIRSTADVAVVGMNRAQWTTDAFLVYPVEVLGTEYVVMSYPSDGEKFESMLTSWSTPSQFAIVATQPNTHVTIEPTAPIKAAPAVMLDAGQVYLVQANMKWALRGDLSGTRIRSTKPIAVFAGHQRATIPLSLRDVVGTSSRDMLMAQMVPVGSWGKEALLFPFVHPETAQTVEGTRYRIIAAYDDTQVFANGSFLTNLRAGQVFEASLLQPLHIVANNPVQVAQFKVTSAVSSGTFPLADPLFLLLPDPVQFDTSYTVILPNAFNEFGDAVFEEFYLVVVVPTALNAVDIVPPPQDVIESRTPIGQSGFEYVTYQVAAGEYRLSAPLPFGVFCYAYGEVESYGYVGGRRVIDLKDGIPPVITAQEHCFSIEGMVVDTGRPRSGLWRVEPIFSECQNVQVNVQFVHSDTALYRATLENQWQDGQCWLAAVDSAGMQSQRFIAIPGMTVHVSPDIQVDSLVTLSLQLVGNRQDCFAIPVVNYGRFVQVIDSVQLRHYAALFEVVRFPQSLQPQQWDTIRVCLRQLIATPMSVVDTLEIFQPCGTRQLVALSLDVQADTVAPQVLRQRVSCESQIQLLLLDPPPFRSGIAGYEVVLMENAILQTIQEGDTLQLSLQIQDPYRDAIVHLRIWDSVGNQRWLRDTIQGFTVRIVATGTGDTAEVQLGESYCFPVIIENDGLLPFVLDDSVWTASNFWFTIPPAQLPMVVPAGEQRSLTVCVYAAVDTLLVDTLVIAFQCLQQRVALYALIKPGIQIQRNRCDLSIRLKTSNVAMSGFWVDKPYPYPAARMVIIPVQSSEAGLYQLSLYTIDGELVDRFELSLRAGRYDLFLDIRRLAVGRYYGVIQNAYGQYHIFRIQKVR